jgi:two-component system OmpR family sensor kinase
VSRLPIRLRLTLVFALAMAVVLAAAALFVYIRLADDLATALDQELRSRAQDVSALVAQEGSLSRGGISLIERGESFAELIGTDGTVLLTPEQLSAARDERIFVNRSSVPGLDEPARMLALPVSRGVLVVGGTRENRAETLSSLRTAFLIGGPLALLLASLGGYVLAGAALRPIEAMRRRAEEISTSSLDERLPVPAADDEVARLGETLNAMLARIESGLERERRFAADASHELRTPLSLLKTELELALRKSRTADELEQTIRSAAAETDRLGRIADDLLLLARSEDGDLPLRLERVDVDDLLESVAARFLARADAEQRTLDVDTESAGVVVADRLRLEQALGNMVDNAFAHGRGEVRLSAVPQNGSVELHVADDGPGFPAEFLDRAFERFSRADDARGRGGSGLGLAIVDTVARAHRGSAHAANRAGGGADVWVTLLT